MNKVLKFDLDHEKGTSTPNHCYKFGNFQAKTGRSKDIKLTTFGLQTYKTICPLFFKEGHKKDRVLKISYVLSF